MTADTVAPIANSGLCTGCGTCVAVCPTRAVRMRQTGSGSLAPIIDPQLCTQCGLCLEVCPGIQLQPGLLADDSDPFTGPIEKAFLAQAGDRELLLGAQSGGVASLLLCHLVRSGAVEGALVTHMPSDGSLRPQIAVARTEQEIMKARGSKYCPVPVNSGLTDNHSDTALALVGCACHIHGIRNAQHLGLLKNVQFTIGLFCDRTLSYALINYLLAKAGIAVSDAQYIAYRDKRWRGWPGDVRIDDAAGNTRWLTRERRMAAKDAFTLPHCRLCFDKLNVFADVSLGDAHGLSEDQSGMSAVLARTTKGLIALRELEAAGGLTLREVDPEAICRQSQRIGERMESWCHYMDAFRELARQVPHFGVRAQCEGKIEAADPLHRREMQWAFRLHRCAHLEEAVALATWRLRITRLLSHFRPYRFRSLLRRLLLGLLPTLIRIRHSVWTRPRHGGNTCA